MIITTVTYLICTYADDAGLTTKQLHVCCQRLQAACDRSCSCMGDAQSANRQCAAAAGQHVVKNRHNIPYTPCPTHSMFEHMHMATKTSSGALTGPQWSCRCGMRTSLRP